MLAALSDVKFNLHPHAHIHTFHKYPLHPGAHASHLHTYYTHHIKLRSEFSWRSAYITSFKTGAHFLFLLYGDTGRHRHMIHSSLLILSTYALNEEHVQLKSTNEKQRMDSVIAVVQRARPALHNTCRIFTQWTVKDYF